MRPSDTISEIGLDGSHRLYVTPSIAAFPMIYRAAMEVHWDEANRRLFSPKPREWTYPDWFRQIIAATRDEYGVELRLTPSTRWVNVPDSLRREIEAAPRTPISNGPPSHDLS